MDQDAIKEVNKPKFDLVRSLNLPLGEYAITSGGPLGIRGLRLISDVDLVVSDDLWDKLKTKGAVITQDGITKLKIVTGQVEALGKGSFYHNHKKGDPSVSEQIKNAEMIEGLPFVKLEYILHFKEKMDREKDIKDIKLIKSFLAQTTD